MSFKPYMNNNEIVLLEKYYRNSKNYFEFGAGGSTCCAIKNWGIMINHWSVSY